MKRLFLLTSGMVILVLLYCAGPFIAFRQLHDAPLRDKETFDSAIDYKALRADLASPESAGKAVDNYLTPHALNSLTWGAGRPSPDWDINFDSDEEPMPRLVSIGLTHATLSVSNPQYDQGTTLFVFERHGLSWILVGIELPAPANGSI